MNQGKGQLNQNNFTPFGGGQRLCPGYHLAKMEIAVILHHFITSFRYIVLIHLSPLVINNRTTNLP